MNGLSAVVMTEILSDFYISKREIEICIPTCYALNWATSASHSHTAALSAFHVQMLSLLSYRAPRL